MDEFMHAALDHLRERDIELTIESQRTHDAPAEFSGCLERNGVSERVRVVAGTAVPVSAVLVHHDERPTLVVTTAVSTKRADSYRRHDIQYIDTAGNAFVRFGDVLVDVRGRHGAVKTPGGARSRNLMSAARAQVVFALLAWPDLLDATQRDVARVAGVSVGQANDTLGLLLDDDWLGQGARRRLLSLWAAAYPNGLGRKLTLASLSGSPTAEIIADDEVLISGERAVPDELRPSSQVLYVRQFDTRLAVRNRWRKDGPPNTTIRRRFWKDPDLSLVPPGRIAPWPLVYADLLAAREPRAREVAESWRLSHED